MSSPDPQRTIHYGRNVPAEEFSNEPTDGQIRTQVPSDSLAGNAALPELATMAAPADYTILGELGRGGMGVVYKAQHGPLQRVVALKMLLAGVHAGAAEAQRFQAEATAVARLQHPNIVQIHEIGAHHGLSYLALEFVDGPSLAKKCAGVALPEREAAGLVETLAHAVQHAHDKGIIHRDLKPGNVLLTSDGVPKVTDFGLARQLEADSGLTASGAIIGTPSFMAPEQAEGRVHELGPAVDVYSLGAILYHLLTGRPPFRGDSLMETVRLVIGQVPVAPRRLNPGLARDLETICLKCLHKDPSRRYASAAALAEDLHRYLAGEPIRARPVGTIERGWRWCRRNPWLAGSLATVALCLVVLAAGSLAVALKLEQDKEDLQEQTTRAEKNEKEALDHLQAADLERRNAEIRLGQARLAEARAYRQSQQPGRRFEALAALGDAIGIARKYDLAADYFNELRIEAIACLAVPVDARKIHEWDALPNDPDPGAMVFDNDLRHYACFGLKDGILSVRAIPDGRELFRLACAQPAYLRFNASGTALLVVHKNRPDGQRSNCQVWDWRANKVLFDVPFMVHAFAPGAPAAFNSTGSRLALGEASGGIAIVDLPSGKTTKFGAGIKSAVLEFSPDDARLAIWSASQGNVHIHDVASGEQQKVWTDHVIGESHLSVSWHPSGRFLAVAKARGHGPSAEIWDVDSGNMVAALSGHLSDVVNVQFSPEGDTVFTASWDGTGRLWEPWTGRVLFEAPRAVWFRGSKGLVCMEAGNRLSLWQVAQGHEYRTLPPLCVPPGNGKGIEHAWVGPDGRWLVALLVDTGTRVWDLARHEAVLAWTNTDAVFAFPADGSTGLALTRSGNTVSQWPVHWREGRIGPPRRIAMPPEPNFIPLPVTRDGRLMAGLSGWGMFVKDLNDPKRPVAVFPEGRFRSDLSADGKWVASGAWHTPGSLAVFDVATSRKVFQPLRDLRAADTFFDPLARWVVVATGNDYQFFSVGSWQPQRTIALRSAAGPVAERISWSADGRFMALPIEPHRMQLREAASDRILTELIPPNRDPALPLLTPDGGRLVTYSRPLGVIRVWDLRLLRSKLSELGLDWDAPPIPPAPDPASLRPLRIEIVEK